MSLFADVMAPYMLVTVKNASGEDGVAAVNMEYELDICCLLKTCTGDRVLRGLLAVESSSMFQSAALRMLRLVALIKHQWPTPRTWDTAENNRTLSTLRSSIILRLRFLGRTHVSPFTQRRRVIIVHRTELTCSPLTP
jgi:hypothetical protein